MCWRRLRDSKIVSHFEQYYMYILGLEATAFRL